MNGFPWMKFKFTNEPGDLTNGKAARMSLGGKKGNIQTIAYGSMLKYLLPISPDILIQLFSLINLCFIYSES